MGQGGACRHFHAHQHHHRPHAYGCSPCCVGRSSWAPHVRSQVRSSGTPPGELRPRSSSRGRANPTHIRVQCTCQCTPATPWRNQARWCCCPMQRQCVLRHAQPRCAPFAVQAQQQRFLSRASHMASWGACLQKTQPHGGGRTATAVWGQGWVANCELNTWGLQSHAMFSCISATR
jgi:hypothetical protein